MKIIFDNTNDETLPIWSVKLTDVDINPEIYLDENNGWTEISQDARMFRRYLLSDPVDQSQEQLFQFFDSEQFIDSILENDEIFNWFYNLFPAEKIKDKEYVKSILSINSQVVKDSVGFTELPTQENNIIVGCLELNLDNYILSPTSFFTGSTEWPAEDIIYQPDNNGFLEGNFYLNTWRFYKAFKNGSKQDSIKLRSQITIEKVFG